MSTYLTTPSAGRPVVSGTVTSAGGGGGPDSTVITISPNARGIAAVSIIPDPDGRAINVVRVDFTKAFVSNDYVFFGSAFMRNGSAYGQWTCFPTISGQQPGYCIFRLIGGQDGNPGHDATSIMIIADGPQV